MCFRSFAGEGMIILKATCLCCHNDWKMWKMKKCEMQKQYHVCSRRGILPLRSSASTAATGWDRRGKLLSQRSAQNNHIWCIGLFASLIAVFCFVYILSSFSGWLPQFIVKDSVEERMVEIQRKKQDLLEKAFGSTSSERKTSRINDVKQLLELFDVWGWVLLRLHGCNRSWLCGSFCNKFCETLCAGKSGVGDLLAAHQLLTWLFFFYPIFQRFRL